MSADRRRRRRDGQPGHRRPHDQRPRVHQGVHRRPELSWRAPSRCVSRSTTSRRSPTRRRSSSPTASSDTLRRPGGRRPARQRRLRHRLVDHRNLDAHPHRRQSPGRRELHVRRHPPGAGRRRRRLVPQRHVGPVRRRWRATASYFDPATDILEVASVLLSLEKEFTDDPVAPGDTVTLEFTVTNLDPASAATAIAFTDDLDAALAGLVAIGLPAADVCGAGSSISGTDFLTFTGGSLAAGGVCTFSVTLQVPGERHSGDHRHQRDERGQRSHRRLRRHRRPGHGRPDDQLLLVLEELRRSGVERRNGRSDLLDHQQQRDNGRRSPLQRTIWLSFFRGSRQRACRCRMSAAPARRSPERRFWSSSTARYCPVRPARSS